MEWHNRQTAEHGLQPNGAERLGPKRAQDGDTGLAVIAFELLLGNEALEMHSSRWRAVAAGAAIQSELARQLLAKGPMVAVAKDETLKRRLNQRQRFQQYIHPFPANDLARIDDQVSLGGQLPKKRRAIPLQAVAADPAWRARLVLLARRVHRRKYPFASGTPPAQRPQHPIALVTAPPR